MACQIWHWRWCHPVAHTHANSSKRHLLAKQHCKGASVSQEKSSHDSMCPLSSQCTHLTWNKVDSIWDASLTVNHSSPHWWDRLTPQRKQAGGVGVTARCPDSILPLPARPLTQVHSHRNMHGNTRGWFQGDATAPLNVAHCQVAGCCQLHWQK